MHRFQARSFIAAVVAVVAALIMMGDGRSRDLDGYYAQNPSPLGDWIKGLRVPEGDGAGGFCCSEADGHFVPFEARKDGWWAKWDGAWYKIDPAIIIKNEASPSELGLIFVWPAGTGMFRCAVPPLNGS